MEKDSGNTLSGMNIRPADNHAEASTVWNPSTLPSLPSTAQTMERSHTASSVEVSRFDGDSYSDIPKFSWHEATREYREEELQRNTIASRISETSIRPSTREKALPFQMKLVEIKTNRLKYSIEEQNASIKYNNAITDLAVEQGKRQIHSEMKKRIALENW